MLSRVRESKTPKYLLLTALIALAVIISMAAAEKANAADYDIKSIEYKQAQESVEFPGSYYGHYWEQYNSGYYGTECDPELYELVLKTGHDNFGYTSVSDNNEPFFHKDDKLIINYVDGSIQTLSPRFASVRFSWDTTDSTGTIIAWVDENNKVTDTMADITWDVEHPGTYIDKNTGFEVIKKGIYNNTATVYIGEKKTTFTKKFIVSGNVAAYDKSIPVINNKKIKSGYTKFHKNTVIDGFWFKWPKYKDAYLYAVKLKQIYPNSLKSSKYGTNNIVLYPYGNNIKVGSNPAYKDIGLTDGGYLTADTMMEISVKVVKEADPEKTGAEYAYGKFSKPVRIFLSKNKALKAKGKKKSVRLTWDKIKNATGYTIKYSTKKNMAKAKTIKVKGGNKKAYTIKKLKKNKKYYFQITPYKVYKGKTYTGYVSAKKAAKAK